ncbi:hypothetical protein CPZ25_017355 [Eubacterium maltosivorans]|uniref:Uncharacterized protein n=1 Tax=Eubacterium maltosivorans TaxID=2041044 RepID=A0A4P9CE76_EUBML|nr:hypothetical protein CPZ25_017355 [Eubacterium maltosivorans]
MRKGDGAVVKEKRNSEVPPISGARLTIPVPQGWHPCSADNPYPEAMTPQRRFFDAFKSLPHLSAILKKIKLSSKFFIQGLF